MQAFWHAHPNSSVTLWQHPAAGATVQGVAFATGQPTSACIDVVPAVGGGLWSGAPQIVRGQNKTQGQEWQGWYSETYNGHWPAPTLVYEAQIEAGVSTFGWLLLPHAQHPRSSTNASLELLSVSDVVKARITIDGSSDVVSVSFGDSGSRGQALV